MMINKTRKSISIFSILFTFFVDNLGWSIVFPVFASIFLDEKNSLLPIGMAIDTRTTILGVFLALFPLAQFFGAPILGELADRAGRKKAFLWSIFLTFFGYFLSGISIHYNLLGLLFVSRIMSGLFSGNLSICLATLSDVSHDEKSKVKFFGYLSVIIGISFVLGVFIGGKFSDSTLSDLFSPAVPFFGAAILSFVNFFFVLFGFKETAEHHKKKRFDLLEGFKNIHEALKIDKIKPAYLIYFLFIFGWTILFQFIPVKLITNFSFTNSRIGDMAAVIGICWAVGSGLINKFLHKIFSSIRLLEFSLFAFAILCILFALPMKKVPFVAIVGMAALFGGMAWPLCTTLISNLAPKHIQGKILGMSQAMQSLAMTISPIFGGISDQIHPNMPFLLSAFAGIVASLVYFVIKPTSYDN